MKSFDLVSWLYELANCSRYSKDANEILKWVKPKLGQKFLDIGGGTGTMANILSKKTGCRFMVVDSSVGMINVGRKRGYNIEWLVADITKQLPLEERSVDGIIMIYTLHHIKRDLQPRTLSELKRVLKSRGKIIFIEMDNHNFFSCYKNLIGKITTFNRVWFLDASQLEKTLKNLGFTKVKYTHKYQGYVLCATKS